MNALHERGPIPTVPASACPACGGSGPYRYRDVADRLYFVPGRWSVRACEACGSLWLDPRPADAALADCYPPHYFTHSDGPGLDALIPRLDGLKGRVRRHVLASTAGYRFTGGPAGPTLAGAVLAHVPPVRRRATHGLGPLLPAWREGGRLLDVGCGNGAYLALLRSYGWDVTGQDIDPAAAAAATSAYGIPVTTAPLATLAATEPGFDVVTASHVIEHVPDPAAFLRDACRCLRPGGELIVVTPNAAALGRRVFGERWYPLDPPRHLVVLSPEGLRWSAKRAGLKVVRLASTAAKARKVTRRAQALGRTGGFDNGPGLWHENAVARAFALVERVLATVAPAGEELILVARRPVDR